MGKRSTNDAIDKAQGDRDFVETPWAAFEPLIPHLRTDRTYCDPCAGAGAILNHLARAGLKVGESFDINPRSARIWRADATKTKPKCRAITNPPYSRRLLMPILAASLTWKHESWWLVPHDLLANLYFAPLAKHVKHILPVGRVSWLDNGKAGMENSSWIMTTPEPLENCTLLERRPRLTTV